MTDNEREEWVHDLAVRMVNRLSDAGVWAFAVDRAVSILETQSDEQLKKYETEAPVKQMHGFKKKKTKEKPFGFS